MSRSTGITLLEMIVVLALSVLAIAATVPALAEMRASALTAAGARHVAVSLHALRWKSVAQGRGHGWLFSRLGDGWGWYVVRDENGNGLRTAEVRNGTDRTLSGPHRLADVASGIVFGFPPGGPFPAVPPRPGSIENVDDPIRIGNTNLLAFAPQGTASSGTLFVTDRKRQLYAVVLYGRTAKLRVWRYSTESGKWIS